MIVPGVSGTYKRELGTRYFKKMGLALLPMLILNAI
jgi:hypothetical protein